METALQKHFRERIANALNVLPDYVTDQEIERWMQTKKFSRIHFHPLIDDVLNYVDHQGLFTADGRHVVVKRNMALEFIVEINGVETFRTLLNLRVSAYLDSQEVGLWR